METSSAISRELEVTKLAKEQSNVLRDKRPSDYVYALMSQQAYEGGRLKEGDNLPGYTNWKIRVAKTGKSDYFGIIYVNQHDKQIVVAHRGLDNIGELKKDLNKIYPNHFDSQREVAFSLMKQAIDLATEYQFYLSFTGYSLGGLLAELCVFYCELNHHLLNVNSVVFDGPGSKESIEKMQSNLKPIDLTQLDCIEYVVYPNHINTFGHHIGTLFYLQANSGYSNIQRNIDNIAALFNSSSIVQYFYLKDWPIEYLEDYFYQIEKLVDNSLSYNKVLPLKHFSPNFRIFLKDFYKWRTDNFLEKDECENQLKQHLLDLNTTENVIKYLLDYKLLESSTDKYIITDNVIDLRLELTAWLEQNEFQKIFKKFSINQESSTHFLKNYLQEFFNVPAYIAGFVVRKSDKNEDILKLIEEKLTSKGICFISGVAIMGMPGIGKTQLSYYYAYMKRSKYKDCVYYINAETITDIVESFRRFIKTLSTEQDKTSIDYFDKQKIMDTIKNILNLIPKSLFIFDNVENEEMIISWLRVVEKHDVLITSRYRNWINIENLVSLDVFNAYEQEQVIGFILDIINNKSSGNETKESATELAKELFWLPLAIGQAVYAIKRNRSISNYLEEYRDNIKRKSLLSKKALRDDIYKYATFNTWDISISRIEKITFRSRELLNICAYLHADSIPKTLFAEYFDDLTTVIETVSDHALINVVDGQKSKDSLKIHRMLQEVIRIQHEDENETIKWICKTIELLNKAFVYRRNKIETATKCSVFIPHIETILKFIKEYVKEELLDENLGILLANVGNYYLTYLRNYSLAIEMFEESLKILPKTQHPFADVYSGLGMAYHCVSKHEKGLEYARRAQIIYREAFQTDENIGNIPCLITMGYVLFVKHEEKGIPVQEEREYLLQAKEKIEGAISISKKIKMENIAEIAHATHGLGSVYYFLGECCEKENNWCEAAELYVKSEKMFREALNKRERLLGVEHVDVARSHDKLGTALVKQGKYEEAIFHYEIALGVQKKYLTNNHSNLVETEKHLNDGKKLHQLFLKYKKVQNLPEYSKFFTGRANKLREIEMNLSMNKLSIIGQDPKIISGQGGIGKTQLALVYGWKCGMKYFGRTRWIEARTINSFEAAWRKFAKDLEVYKKLEIRSDELDNLSLDKIKESVFKRLEEVPSILVIFDNADDQEITDQIKKDIKLIDKKHHFLITSRTKKWGLLSNIDLTVFDKEEARSFILEVLNGHYNGKEEEKDADELAETLKCFPLALAQAVHTIGSESTMHRYLLDYRKKFGERKRLLSKSIVEEESYEFTVFNTWDFSRQKVEKKSPMAVEILNLCAYLYSDNIPKFLFDELDNANDATSILCDQSLVTVTNGIDRRDSLTVHQLLQEVIRMNLQETNEEEEWINKALNLLFTKFNYDLKNLESISKTEQIIPHVLSIVRHAYRLSIDIDKAEKLFKKVLHFYNYWKQGFGALELAKEFMNYQKGLYGDKSVKYADALVRLAEIEYYHSIYQTSEEHYKQANQIYEADSQLQTKYEYIDSVAGLGDVYHKTGQYSNAIKQYEYGLNLLKTYNGKKKCFLFGMIYHQLGNVYNKLKKIQEAKKYYEDALINKQGYYKTDRHPQIARTQKELADIYLLLKDYEIAYKYIQLALEVERTHYKTDYHPDVEKALCVLAEIQFEFGKKTEALDNFEHSTKIWKKIYPENHPGLAINFLREGNLYLRHELKDKARGKFLDAYNMLEKKFGSEHPQTKSCKEKLNECSKNFKPLEERIVALKMSKELQPLKPQKKSTFYCPYFSKVALIGTAIAVVATGVAIETTRRYY